MKEKLKKWAKWIFAFIATIVGGKIIYDLFTKRGGSVEIKKIEIESWEKDPDDEPKHEPSTDNFTAQDFENELKEL